MHQAEQLSQTFKARYGRVPRVYRAPGRVNLIGEHTDYNDGFVMPAAIGMYAWLAIAPREDRLLNIASENFPNSIEVDLDHIVPGPTSHWSDYVRGVAATLQNKGHRLRGADILVRGEVPIGSGLSSSAALEVAAGYALLDIASQPIDRVELALAAQSAEHEYVGTRCGIMDQFISCHGRAEHALMLDTRSLTFELLPLPKAVSIVICNTMVRHELASGEYNKRRAECEAGVRRLASSLPGIKALRDVTSGQLALHAHELPEIVLRRCRHVVTEDERVLAAARALKEHDFAGFGKRMGESHVSLRDDYEVSCPELDTMVDLANRLEGVYGARMTGGGFGGCTVNLVRADAAAGFQSQIAKEYERVIGKKPDIYVCAAAEGVGAAE